MSADTVCSPLQSEGCESAHVDASPTHQQQRTIDLLQLRSDELSAENGKLRLQVASSAAGKQLPEQLSGDGTVSYAAKPVQHVPQYQSCSRVRPTSSGHPSVGRYTGHADR